MSEQKYRVQVDYENPDTWFADGGTDLWAEFVARDDVECSGLDNDLILTKTQLFEFIGRAEQIEGWIPGSHNDSPVLVCPV